jgi:hypothetical protein
MILNEPTQGACGLIYWYERTKSEVPQNQVDQMRQKAMSDMLYGAIQTASYSGANQSMDIQTAMQRGWNEANRQVEMIERGTLMKQEMFLIGDPNTIPRLTEIENDPNFQEWINPYLIQQIKNQ